MDPATIAANTPIAAIPTMSMPNREAAPVALGEEPVVVPLLEPLPVLAGAVVVTKPELLLVVEVWPEVVLVPVLDEELVVGAETVTPASLQTAMNAFCAVLALLPQLELREL